MGKESRLVIEPSKVLASESFYITHETVLGDKSFNFHNTEAPALALAVLEAAGYEEHQKGWDVLNSADENFAQAMRCLSKGLELQERATAEAEAQAKLEAEALELYQLWETLQSDDETVWLAVARRAREMRAEK